MRILPARLLKQVLFSQLSSGQARAPLSPVQGYHQEKPEAERPKDRLMDTCLSLLSIVSDDDISVRVRPLRALLDGERIVQFEI